VRITDITLQQRGDQVTAEARVAWEDCDRTPLTHYVQIDAEFADSFRADPNGFFLAALLPAWHAGERRIQVEGTLCSILPERSRAALLIRNSPLFQPLKRQKDSRPDGPRDMERHRFFRVVSIPWRPSPGTFCT
jgi:hypothetical protein